MKVKYNRKLKGWEYRVENKCGQDVFGINFVSKKEAQKQLKRTQEKIDDLNNIQKSRQWKSGNFKI